MTRTEILAVAKPILFNGDMVKAILDNRKRCTRRVIKLRWSNTHFELRTDKYGTCLIEIQNEDETTCIKNPDGSTTHKLLAARKVKPRYRKGDLLYVRETFYFETFYCEPGEGTWAYKADNEDYPVIPGKWRPSIHMPKEAARIFLRVADVRAERLQKMRSCDAWKEGTRCNCMSPVPDCAGNKDAFIKIWNSTIKPADLPLYGWDANPWVWVYEFERVEAQP